MKRAIRSRVAAAEDRIVGGALSLRRTAWEQVVQRDSQLILQPDGRLCCAVELWARLRPHCQRTGLALQQFRKAKGMQVYSL